MSNNNTNDKKTSKSYNKDKMDKSKDLGKENVKQGKKEQVKDEGKKDRKNKKNCKTEKVDINKICEESFGECFDNKLTSMRQRIVNVNIIRREIIRLKLNPEKKIFFENDIEPLLRVFDSLSLASQNYGVAVSKINGISFAKSSEIKALLDLIYEITDKSEDVFNILDKEVDILLKIYKCDLKK